MQIQISITLLPEEEKDQNIINSKIKAELKKSVKKEDLAKGFEPVFVKKSIDARHGQLKLHLRYNVFIGEKAGDEAAASGDQLPVWKKAGGDKSVIRFWTISSFLCPSKSINTACSEALSFTIFELIWVIFIWYLTKT